MILDINRKILEETREAVGLTSDTTDFDTDLLQHINNATATLNINGIGKFIVISKDTTWGDFQDPNQIMGNRYFHMIPLYVTLSTKIIFDPPPPSSVEHHVNNAAKILWSLKVAYEETGGDV